MNKIIISIEGNIGCGKTTFINLLNKNKNFKTVKEPLDKWQNLNGINLLENMYKHNKTFNFQSYALLTRFEILTKPFNQEILLMERSLLSHNIFLEICKQQKTLNNLELFILNELQTKIHKQINKELDLIIYLKTDPLISYERIKNRNRTEENQLKFEYIKQLHEIHQKIIIKQNTKTPIIILNANHNIEIMKNSYKNCEFYLKNLLKRNKV